MPEYIAIKISGEQGHRWYDLDEMKNATPKGCLPPGVGSVMGMKFHATNRFIERDDGALAQIWEIDAAKSSLVHQDRMRAAREEFEAHFKDECSSGGSLFGFDTMPKPFQVSTERIAWALFLRGKGLKS